MVLGHSGAPFTHWIFLFHMAVFYIAAGYTWNNKHVQSFSSLKKYILNKIKTLYVPYIFCNILFLLLNNVFIEGGIYASSEEYLFLIGSEDTSLLHTKLSFIQIAKHIVAICFLIKGTELGGPTWFFASLFVTLCVYAVLEYILSKAFKQKRGLINVVETILAVTFLGVAWLISEDSFSLHVHNFNRFFAAYPLLLLGSFLKMIDKKISWGPVMSLSVAVLAFVLLWVMNGYGSISMARSKIENPMFFLIVSLSGWYLLVALSHLIPRSSLTELGASTRSIVMWHFISMKGVTWAYIVMVGLPMVLLGAFPFLENTTPYMWVIYTIVGVGVPYFFGVIYDRIKFKVCKNNK